MTRLLFLLVLSVVGCSDQSNQDRKVLHGEAFSGADSVGKVNRNKYYTTMDTLVITTETADTLVYSKDEFNTILDRHPELLNSNGVDNPDLLYHCSGNQDEFASEVGQGTYFILYAYLLKQKNGKEKYEACRKNLIDIYSNINDLFSFFEYGGTYFGHQQARILGYAEFSVYLFKQQEQKFAKTYDISKEKALYIKLLRQMIADESSIDYNTNGKQEKEKRNKELNVIVDQIDTLIKNNFYLKRAQAFQAEHYEYY